MNKKLEDLLKKREQINAQIQKARARQNAQERKEETRRKILLGALVKEMMDNGELDETLILKRLEGFLTREIDRKLFDFPVKAKAEREDNKTGTTQTKKMTSSKRKSTTSPNQSTKP